MTKWLHLADVKLVQGRSPKSKEEEDEPEGEVKSYGFRMK